MKNTKSSGNVKSKLSEVSADASEAAIDLSQHLPELTAKLTSKMLETHAVHMDTWTRRHFARAIQP